MDVKHFTFNADGTRTETTKNVPDDYFSRPSVAPTTEERLAALEAAMLSMMGVSADV